MTNKAICITTDGVVLFARITLRRFCKISLYNGKLLFVNRYNFLLGPLPEMSLGKILWEASIRHAKTKTENSTPGNFINHFAGYNPDRLHEKATWNFAA